MRTKNIISGLTGGALLVFLLTTSPDRLPSFLLPLPFLILFLLTFWVLHTFASIWLPAKKARWVASVGSGVPIILLVLQSIGQLAPRDVLTVLAFFTVSYFYIVRSRPLLR